MSATEARAIFNGAIEEAGDADAVARLELAREYFTNPTFRKNLEQFVWEINQAKGV